jgi:hypothetical protein
MFKLYLRTNFWFCVTQQCGLNASFPLFVVTIPFLLVTIVMANRTHLCNDCHNLVVFSDRSDSELKWLRLEPVHVATKSTAFWEGVSLQGKHILSLIYGQRNSGAHTLRCLHIQVRSVCGQCTVHYTEQPVLCRKGNFGAVRNGHCHLSWGLEEIHGTPQSLLFNQF